MIVVCVFSRHHTSSEPAWAAPSDFNTAAGRLRETDSWPGIAKESVAPYAL